MGSLLLAALLLAAPSPKDQACIDQIRDTCLQGIAKCPRPVDLAPAERSCLSCGVTWLRGELASDALAALTTAIRKATESPVTVIEAWVDKGTTTARVHAVVSCARGHGAGDIFLFVKKGARWSCKSHSSWTE